MIPIAAPGRGRGTEGRFPRREAHDHGKSNEISIPGKGGIEDSLYINFTDGRPTNVVVNDSYYYDIRGRSIGTGECSVTIKRDERWLEIFYSPDGKITKYK